jgi:hypothetical protein
MVIQLDNIRLWKDLGIKNPTGNLEDDLRKFYYTYPKEIKAIIPGGTIEDKIKYLKIKVNKDPMFLIDIFSNHVERQIKSSKFSKIRLKKFDIKNLEKYSRKILKELRGLEIEKETYIRPKNYPSVVYRPLSKRGVIILKKLKGIGKKTAKQIDYYNSYIEKIIVITKKGDSWILRNSLSNGKEKKIIKDIFKTKFLSYSREGMLKELYGEILSKGEIIEIKGSNEFNKNRFLYTLESENNENSSINSLLSDEASKLLVDDNSIYNISLLKFRIANKNISLSFIPTKLNIIHIKLETKGLEPSTIEEINDMLKSNLKLQYDTYLFYDLDKNKKIDFILNNSSLQEPHTFILANEIEELKREGIIETTNQDSFKKCFNSNCDNKDSSEFFEISIKNCPECNEPLRKIGSKVKITKSKKGIKKWIKKSLKGKGYEYLGDIDKSFNKLKLSFLKFMTPSKKEFLILVQGETRKKLEELVLLFNQRSLPVLFISLNEQYLDSPIIDNSSVGKIGIAELYKDLIFGEGEKITLKLENLESKYDTWKTNNFEKSYQIFVNYIHLRDLEEIERGTSIQSKGRVFERLSSLIFKRICNFWHELGQNKQNQSVPDGLGLTISNNKNFIFGFDAKLKRDGRKGLTKKEIVKQAEYIKDFRNKAKKYGGLKGWILLIKSEEDYKSFNKSINEIRRLSGFEKITVLGLENLIELSKLYREGMLPGKVFDFERFSQLIYKILNYKGFVSRKRFDKEVANYNKRLFKIELS